MPDIAKILQMFGGVSGEGKSHGAIVDALWNTGRDLIKGKPATTEQKEVMPQKPSGLEAMLEHFKSPINTQQRDQSQPMAPFGAGAASIRPEAPGLIEAIKLYLSGQGDDVWLRRVLSMGGTPLRAPGEPTIQGLPEGGDRIAIHHPRYGAYSVPVGPVQINTVDGTPGLTKLTAKTAVKTAAGTAESAAIKTAFRGAKAAAEDAFDAAKVVPGARVAVEDAPQAVRAAESQEGLAAYAHRIVNRKFDAAKVVPGERVVDDAAGTVAKATKKASRQELIDQGRIIPLAHSPEPILGRVAQEGEVLPLKMKLTPEDRVVATGHSEIEGAMPVNVEKASEALSRRLVQERMPPSTYAPKNDPVVLPPTGAMEHPLVIGRLSPEQWQQYRMNLLSPDELQEARVWYQNLYGNFESRLGEVATKSELPAWAVSQQQASPADGYLNVMRVKNQLEGRPSIWWRKPSPAATKASVKLMATTSQARYTTVYEGLSDELKALFPAIRPPAAEMEAVLRQRPALDTFTPGLAAKKIEAVLQGRTPKGGVGKKLSDFYDSAYGKELRTYMGNDPLGGKPAPIDVWSGRDIGFMDQPLLDHIEKHYGADVAAEFERDYNGAIDNNRYEYGVNFYQKVADRLNEQGIMGGGWTPREAQAVGWVAKQKAMGKLAQGPEDIFGKNTRRIAFELSFGDDSPLSVKYPAMTGLPYKISNAITQEVSRKTVDLLAKDAGVHELKLFYGPGGYENYPVQPSGQLDVLAPPERVQDFIDSLGYVLNQTEVLASRGSNSKSAKQALQIVLDAPEEAMERLIPEFWNRLRLKVPEVFGAAGSGFSPAVEGDRIALRVFPSNNRSFKDMAKLQDAIDQTAGALGITINKDKTRLIGIDMMSAKNTWKDNPNGEKYLASLGSRGRSDLQGRLDSVYRPQVEAWIEEAFHTHAPGQLKSHRRATRPAGVFEKVTPPTFTGTSVPVVPIKKKSRLP